MGSWEDGNVEFRMVDWDRKKKDCLSNELVEGG